jgi:hypothetical protein
MIVIDCSLVARRHDGVAVSGETKEKLYKVVNGASLRARLILFRLEGADDVSTWSCLRTSSAAVSINLKIRSDLVFRSLIELP